MRTLEELVDQQNPALPLLLDWTRGGANEATILPPNDAARADTLLCLQVTTRSMLGAIAYETGGVLIAGGLIRLLGSDAGWSLRAANEAAGLPLNGFHQGAIIVADDMLGGLFSLNGGRFGPDQQGHVFHLAADAEHWIPLEMGFGDFVYWCLHADLNKFYGPLAELEVWAAEPRPAFGTTYTFFPFLFTQEGQDGPPTASIVPADESLRFRIALCSFGIE